MAASPQIQFRAVGPLGESIMQRATTSNPVALSEVVRRDLDRYYIMLQQAAPTFSEQEALLIVDAMNGHLCDPRTVRLIWAEVSDALQDGLDKKYDVDGVALVKRLRSLAPIECMALADAVERAWNGPYHVTNMGERVQAVGLVRDAQDQ